MTAPAKRVRLHKLVADNVKGLKHIAVSFNRGITKVSGGNGAGKTSLSDAVVMLFQGAKVIPGKPIREGEETATAIGEFGGEEVEFIVTRKFRRDGDSYKTEVSIVTPQGAKFPSPQAMLDQFGAQFTIDPLELQRLAGSDTAKFRAKLLDMLGLSQPVAELDRFTKTDYDERTALNRELKQKQRQLAGMPAGDASLVAIDVSAVMVQMTAANVHNDLVRKLQGQHDTANAKASANTAEIARLERLIAGLHAEISKILEWQANNPVPEMANTDAFMQQMQDAQSINAEVARIQQRETLADAIAHIERDAKALTGKIAQRETEKAALMQSADWPVEGLGVSDNSVTLHGIPIDQISQAETLLVFCSIAMAMNPGLRWMRVKDASLCDQSSLAALEEWATEHDFDVLLECVDESGTVGIYIEDGEIVTNNYDAPKAGRVRKAAEAVP